MELTVRLKGLNCPHCAAKIEAASKKIAHVRNAQVNLLRQEMKLEIEQENEAVKHMITKAVKNIEPDVEVEFSEERLEKHQAESCHCPAHSHEEECQSGYCHIHSHEEECQSGYCHTHSHEEECQSGHCHIYGHEENQLETEDGHSHILKEQTEIETISEKNNYSIRLEGLDCPNCAAKIETGVKALKQVEDASVNLMREELKLSLAAGEEISQVLPLIEGIVKKYEPDVNVFYEEKKTSSAVQNGIVIRLEGLDCPNCAAKIETGVRELEAVADASVNLMKQQLTVTLQAGYTIEEEIGRIQDIVKKYEPDVRVIVEKEKKRNGAEEEVSDFRRTLKKRIALYAVGLALFLVARLVPVSHMVSIGFYLAAYLIFGLDVLLRAIKNISRGQVFDENFLMSVSTLGALAMGEMAEAVFVMFFYQVGETFQSLAVDRSRRSIQSLMNIRPDFANIEIGGKITQVNPEDVNIGDTILVRPGEKVPLDGTVLSGESFLDTSALTGESVPRKAMAGSQVLSGSINTNGVLYVKVTKTFGSSTAMKILELVENASAKKSQTEQFITKFAKVYTPIVVFLAVALAVIPPLVIGGGFQTWISRALIFLVISCPCALVLSVPLGFFSGIGEASRKGILVKGSNYIQILKDVDTVVMDKTGTLTKGTFTVTKIVSANSFPEDELLRLAAMGEKMSTHPIAKSIVEAYEEKYGAVADAQSYEEISGHGVLAVINGKQVALGNQKLMKDQKVSVVPYEGIGSVVYVSVDGVYAGYLVVSDVVKPDSAEGIRRLKQCGVNNIVMLTGDSRKNAEETGKLLGITTVYAELLPQDKVSKMEEILASHGKGKVAFVGDGINDAPVLARADVGVAMGGVGSDAAIEAADVVIMNDEISKLADGIIISKNTNRIVMENIIFALGVKILALVLGAVGVASMWMAVFADVGVALLAVLNSMRKKI